VEVEICSTFQTHSNIYTVHAVNIVEQYIGAAENSKYATKQNSEKVRLLKGGAGVVIFCRHYYFYYYYYETSRVAKLVFKCHETG
jgi:hypothetical protein